MLFIRQQKPELNVQRDSVLLKFLFYLKLVFIHLDSHFAKYLNHLFNYVLFYLFNYLVW